MKATAIVIKNILGIDEFRIEPGRITRLKGQNEAGKSSVLGAIGAALQGGNLASVQKVNQETGEPVGVPEIQLVLDDGQFRVEREGKDTRVFERVDDTRAEKKTPRPATFIAGLFDKELSNPLNMLDGSPAKRLDWLLQVLPLNLTPAEVKAAVGDELWPLVEKDAAEGHPLHVLTAVRKKIFDARTGINVSKDDKEATYKQLEAKIPAKMPEATKDGVATLERQRDVVSERVQKAKAAADHALKEKNAAARATHDGIVSAARESGTTRIAQINSDLTEAINVLRAKAQEQIDAVKAEVVSRQDAAATKLAELQGDAENERQAAIAAIVADEQEFSMLTGDLERARAQVESNTVLLTQIEMVERFKADHADLKGKSERYTAGLAAVDALKGRLLADLPIQGLSIDGTDIKVNNVLFDQLNEGQRVTIAVKVAALRAKQRALPILMIDRAESLDAKNLAALEAAILAEGCQAFIAIRTEGPLTVETA